MTTSPDSDTATRCNRCGGMLEPPPLIFADEICGPYADLIVSGPCDHVPLCVDCADFHVGEVIADIEFAREQDPELPLTEIESAPTGATREGPHHE